MKTLVFDTGPIISLTTNNLLWLLEPLKNKFKGRFVITEGVRKELIDKPLATKKFKFEALQVEKQIEAGVLEVVEDKRASDLAFKYLDLANKCFYAQKTPIQILQYAEMETIAYATITNADSVVVDERITRALIESPESIQEVMQNRLHTKVTVNKEMLDKLIIETRHLKLIRSIELVTIAYEKGFLNKYVVNLPNAKKTLLESVLWGVKLNGCSVSESEINAVLRVENEV